MASSAQAPSSSPGAPPGEGAHYGGGPLAAAIVGLVPGRRFYEGGIFATALILAAEMFLSKLEYRMLDNAPGGEPLYGVQ